MPLSTTKWGSQSAGGVDSVCQMLVKELASSDRGFYYRVLAFDPTNTVKNLGKIVQLSDSVEIVFYHIRNGRKWPNAISQYSIISQQVGVFLPDIVHSHLLSWLVNFKIKVPSLATLHGYKNIARASQGVMNDLVYERFFPAVASYFIDRVTCVTNHFKTSIVGSTNLPVDVVYNPIESRYFECKHQVNSKSEVLEMVTCALLTKRKGIHHIIKVLEIINKSGVNAHLTVIGPPVSKAYYEELAGIIAECGLSDKICFVGHKMTHEIIDIYEKSDLGIFLSEEETFGLAPLEMLASGLPVIASRTGVMNDFEDKELNIKRLKLYDFDDYVGVSELIMMFHDNNNAFIDDNMGLEISDLFSSAKIVNEYEAIYENLMR